MNKSNEMFVNELHNIRWGISSSQPSAFESFIPSQNTFIRKYREKTSAEDKVHENKATKLEKQTTSTSMIKRVAQNFNTETLQNLRPKQNGD